MGRISETNSSRGFWKPIFTAVAMLFTLSLTLSLLAQKADPSAPKYDLSTEAKIKATVDEVKLPPDGSKNKNEAAHLLVKIGADTADVYLCPKSFLDDMGMTFTKGEEITLTGSKVKQGDADLILARLVVKGTDTLMLRDEKGNPIWSWHR